MNKMSKLNKLFFGLSMIIISQLVTGCTTTFDSFIEGTYISTEGNLDSELNEGKEEIISGIKLELYHISAKTYSEANGINVVKDTTKSDESQYFSYNLYLYIDEFEDYYKIYLIDIEGDVHTPTYHCHTIDKDASYNVNGISFTFMLGRYDTWFEFWFKIDGVLYSFNAYLVENNEEGVM